MSRSADRTAAQAPSGLRSRHRGTSHPADGSRIPWCRIDSEWRGFCCALARLTPATTATAASAVKDRWNVDFIALLPLQPGRLRVLLILKASRDEFSSAVMIRRENVSTIMTGEKRGPPGADRANQIEKKFLRRELFFETILCRSAALRCVSVATCSSAMSAMITASPPPLAGYPLGAQNTSSPERHFASNASIKRDRNSRKATISFGEKTPNTRRSTGSTRSRAV